MNPMWLLLALGYAAVLLALEFRRPDRSWRRSRMLAVGAVVLALVALANTHVGQPRGALTLLTPGAPLSARSRDAVWLDQVASPPAALEEARTLRLVGWGLLPEEWPDSLTLPLTFEPAPLPPGITALARATETVVGAPFVLRGAVTLGDAAAGWVILEDPSGPRDSAEVTAAQPEFELVDRPRAAGAAAYRLRLRGPGLPETAETLGVAVRADRPPAVLVLDASPSFETTYLKRWLTGRGARLTVRTTLTRGHFRTERINDGGAEPDRLTGDLLGRYDAVLADGPSLAALSATEREALLQAVRQDGLGVLVTAEPGAAFAPGGPLPLALTTADGGDSAARSAEHRVVRPMWRNAPRRSRTGIEAAAQCLARGAGFDPLVKDESGRILAGTAQLGNGRVAVTLLHTPSRWLLEGEDDLFASYWLGLISAVARDTMTRVAVESDGPPRADLPVRVRLLVPGSRFRVPGSSSALGTRNSELPAINPGAPAVSVTGPTGLVDTVPLARDPFDPRIWSGRYWPTAAGWHQLQVGAGRRVPFRVTAPGEWRGLEATARLTASLPRRGAAPAEPLARVSRAWLRGLSFLLVLLVLSTLWAENRRRTG